MKNRAGLFGVGRCFLLAAGVLLAGGAAARAQSVSLSWKPYMGMTYKVQQSSNINLTLNVTANGQPQQTVNDQIATQRGGTVTVVSIDNGQVSAIQVAYDQNCGNVETSSAGANAGQPQNKPFPFAGQTVGMSRDATGHINLDYHGPNTPDADSVAELRAILDPDLGRYPQGSVAVGQQWHGGRDALAHSFNFSQQDDGSMDCTLQDVENYNGHQVARVGADVTATTFKGPMKLGIHMTGTILYDIATGLPLKSDLAGDVTANMQSQQTGQDGTPITLVLNGTGKAQITFAADVAGNAPAGPPQPTGQPGGLGAFGPPAPPAPAPAPPAGGATAAAFNGTFTNDKMSLTLQSQADGSYTGTIQFNQQTYQVTAQIGDTGMTGKFQTPNGAFDFTATLTPDNELIFTTPGTNGPVHFTLKRQAPAANPLDQAPAAPAQPTPPPNPLGQ